MVLLSSEKNKEVLDAFDVVTLNTNGEQALNSIDGYDQFLVPAV
jgi:hypothetical protein